MSDAKIDKEIDHKQENVSTAFDRLFKRMWFGLVSLFNGISTFVDYLMPKPFSQKKCCGTI